MRNGSDKMCGASPVTYSLCNNYDYSQYQQQYQQQSATGGCPNAAPVRRICSGQSIPEYETDLANEFNRHLLNSQNMATRSNAVDNSSGIPAVGSTGGVGSTQIRADGTITVLDGMITISGEGADRVANVIEQLYERSPTFRNMVDNARAKGETASIIFGELNGMAGYSTIGAGNERVTLDYDMATTWDEQLYSLVSHELGHAFGDYTDGPSGGVGGNQRYNSQVGFEMGYIDTADARPYDGTLWG